MIRTSCRSSLSTLASLLKVQILIFEGFNDIFKALMGGEKALARIGGFSKLVKTNQKGTVNYWRQEKSKPDWGYIQPQNMMEDTIPFNASDRFESWKSKRSFINRF